MTPANTQTTRAYSRNPNRWSVNLGYWPYSGGRTWLDRIVEDLINSLDILIRRGVEHNDDGSDQADGDAQFPQHAQLFVEEVGPQHGSYQD